MGQAIRDFEIAIGAAWREMLKTEPHEKKLPPTMRATRRKDIDKVDIAMLKMLPCSRAALMARNALSEAEADRRIIWATRNRLWKSDRKGHGKIYTLTAKGRRAIEEFETELPA